MKFLFIGIAGILLNLANPFINTIIDKQFVPVTNSVAVAQLKEGSAYQDMAYLTQTRNTLHMINEVVYWVLTLVLLSCFIYSSYKMFYKETK